ncbi:serine/threonine-protein kinase pim-3-like isoform X2 [Siphateles boraxobius]|uniref:serine/threonine-protein kinase pim-3-like isoform X2 n=1 Tax=Siphateles boraxobius TaxID=180520 RepID=UPI004062B676
MGVFLRRKWRAIKRSVKSASDWFADGPVDNQDPADLRPLSVSSPSTLDSGIAPAVEKQSKRRVKKDISSFIQRTWKTIKVSALCCYGDDTVDPDPADLQPRISVLAWELTDPELSFILGPSSHEVTPVPSSSSLKLADPEPKPVPGASGLWSATGGFSSFYEVKAVLGTGGFGTVCEGTRRCDGQKVAIKFRPKKYWDKFTNLPGSTKPLLMEVAVNLLMRKSQKSPHIVQMLDWFAEPEQFVLIMEYPHPCETLLKFCLRNGGSLDEAVARGLMRQAVLAAEHCVDRGVFHKDIKTDNILVNTETLQLTFIDFGCCELFKTCEGREWAVRSTVWSLGRVLLEIVSGSQPLNVLHSGKLDPLRPTLSKAQRGPYPRSPVHETPLSDVWGTARAHQR